MKKTLVLGASLKPSRFSHMAIILLRQFNHPVVAIGLREGQVEDVPIFTHRPILNDVHTITIYMNKTSQEAFYDFILTINPKRIIFNPGTENNVLEQMALDKGIEVVKNCTLVMLNSDIF